MNGELIFPDGRKKFTQEQIKAGFHKFLEKVDIVNVKQKVLSKPMKTEEGLVIGMPEPCEVEIKIIGWLHNTK